MDIIINNVYFKCDNITVKEFKVLIALCVTNNFNYKIIRG